MILKTWMISLLFLCLVKVIYYIKGHYSIMTLCIDHFLPVQAKKMSFHSVAAVTITLLTIILDMCCAHNPRV